MRRVQSNGIDLEYETFGSLGAPPMMLIQGLGAQMIGWRTDLCGALAARGYFVIRFDNRDTGGSSWFPNGQYTLADMADDAGDLLVGLGIENAHVVGQSLGGMIAQQLAIRHPDLVRSLCLIYSMPDASYLQTGSEWLTERFRPPAETRPEAIERFIEDERWCGSRDYPFDEAWIRELGGLMWDRGYNPEGVRRQVAAAESTEISEQDLAGIHAPTLLLHGDADRLIPDAASRALADLIPDTTLRIIGGMGHELPRSLWPELVAAITAHAAAADEAIGSRACA